MTPLEKLAPRSSLTQKPTGEERLNRMILEAMRWCMEICNMDTTAIDEELMEIPSAMPPANESKRVIRGKSPTVSESKEEARVHVRWMIRRDMPEVLQTEQLSFEYAWNEEDFLRCFRQRNCIGMVAEHGEKVVGHMIYELHKNKLHILNFAVNPAWRRYGVGAQMTAKLISKLSNQRRTRITLEMRETNLAAQLFFHRQEFKATRVLRTFYEDSGEDAYLMEYRLEGSPDPPPTVQEILASNRILQHLEAIERGE